MITAPNTGSQADAACGSSVIPLVANYYSCFAAITTISSAIQKLAFLSKTGALRYFFVRIGRLPIHLPGL